MLTTVHRFTPPTCTLEIKGKKSPLSRWTNQPVLKKIRFKLSFDDPRLPSYKQVLLTGDRDKLEALKTSVDNYVQDLLHNSFAPNRAENQSANIDRNLPYLTPKGLTKHELFFGNLSHDSRENKTTLSTVQLFDLVAALEGYSSQISALPELQQDSSKKNPTRLWGGIAAAALAGVGIAAILLNSTTPQNIASSPQTESSSDTSQFDEVIPPSASPSSSDKNLQVRTSEPLSSAERLPPPPAVDKPKPKPNIPDPADYPLSEIARQSGLSRQTREEITEDNSAEGSQSIVILPNERDLESEIESQLENNSDRKQREIAPQIANSPPEIPDNSATSNIDLYRSKPTPTKPDRLQEIRAFFREKWQPPQDLKQSLEYRLHLNSDGSIQRVVPIGKASKLYLSQTNIPVRGESFISPLEESDRTKIRLLLSPDGGVKAFAE
ncbi:MAG: DUF4335 domain-containing protein [Cyanobacteria bacterium P01_G01_bin.19]